MKSLTLSLEYPVKPLLEPTKLASSHWVQGETILTLEAKLTFWERFEYALQCLFGFIRFTQPLLETKLE